MKPVKLVSFRYRATIMIDPWCGFPWATYTIQNHVFDATEFSVATYSYEVYEQLVRRLRETNQVS